MRKKIIPSAIAFILAIMLSGYIYLSVCAGRALKTSEFTKFSSTIIRAAIFHLNENGGSRALRISREALSSAQSSSAIEITGRDYVFPLPKYSVRRNEGEGMQHYLVVESFDELQDYFERELPEAGWKQID